MRFQYCNKTRSLVLIFVLIALFFSFSPGLVAAEAPAFNLPTDSSAVSLKKLQGKVVYLDFWASWCTPCRKSFPWMNEIQSKYKDQGLVVIAVNLDKSKDKANEFLSDFKTNFIIAFDPEGTTAENYKVMGMPSSYLINRKGQLQLSHIGFKQADTAALETKIRELLKH